MNNTKTLDTKRRIVKILNQMQKSHETNKSVSSSVLEEVVDDLFNIFDDMIKEQLDNRMTLHINKRHKK